MLKIRGGHYQKYESFVTLGCHPLYIPEDYSKVILYMMDNNG
jgi:hypothetical protein